MSSSSGFILGGIGKFFGGIAKGIGNVVGGIVKGISGVVGGIINTVKDVLGGPLGQILMMALPVMFPAVAWLGPVFVSYTHLTLPTILLE